MKFILQRLFFCALSWLLLLVVCFIMTRLLPGDPLLDDNPVPKHVYEQLKREWGLDLPWHAQLKKWLYDASKGDLGNSIYYPDLPVFTIIKDKLFLSFSLGSLAFFFCCLIGFTTAIALSLCPCRACNQTALLLLVLLFSLPSFLCAALLQLLFSMKLAWLPLARYEGLTSLLLPAFSLAIGPGAYLAHLLYGLLQQMQQQPFIRMAQAKGLYPFTLLMRHSMRNALPPLLAYLGPLTALLLTGSFIVETVFALPGLGRALIESISQRDYPLTLPLILLYSSMQIICIFAADLLTLWADPRQHRKKELV